jgi:hypothetical protein
MREHWPDVISADPAYNRNLSLGDPDDRLAFPPRVPSAEREPHAAMAKPVAENLGNA